VASPPDPLGHLPREPGSYLLVLRTGRRLDRVVGRLGTRRFRRGWHVYAGSARAGLRARLRHHLAGERPVHWHVDVLRKAARLVELWVVVGNERVECALAAALATLPSAERCAGFGSSDCCCPGHLVSFARRPPLVALWPGLTRVPLQRLLPCASRGRGPARVPSPVPQ
jgi:sugar fermentation stimulation protein A